MFEGETDTDIVVGLAEQRGAVGVVCQSRLETEPCCALGFSQKRHTWRIRNTQQVAFDKICQEEAGHSEGCEPEWACKRWEVLQQCRCHGYYD